jgi:DNA-binding IclR family transcriptional regulator
MSNAAAQETAGGRTVAPVQSVDRALNVLEILARVGEAGVTEIALELGVHKSTAFRLVAVLESRGFVEQTSDRGSYRLGFGIVRLAGATTAQLDLNRESRLTCEALAADLGETVNIAILDGDGATNISQIRGAASIASHNWVGQRTPLHATSSGKVLLAFAPQLVQESIATGPLERYTDATLGDADALRATLADVRHQGWAQAVEEYEVGLNALAAPIRGHDGSVVAAVSVSGPSYRLTPDSFASVLERLTAAAADMSRRIGFYG